jgi:hypothetical protein
MDIGKNIKICLFVCPGAMGGKQVRRRNHMTDPTIHIRIPEGTVLTDEERAGLLAEAILVRFRKELQNMPEDKRRIFAKMYADKLIQFANQCGEKHLTNELSSHISLNQPSDEECKSLEQLTDQMNIKFYDVKNSSKKGLIEKAAGVTWLNFRRFLGLPDLPPDNQTGNVAGPRG